MRKDDILWRGSDGRRPLGDIPPEQVDPLQKRYLVRPGQDERPDPALVVPKDRMTIEEQQVWEAKADILAKYIRVADIFSRRLNYLDPPPSAIPIDIPTPIPVSIAAGTTDGVIIELTVPKGAVVVIRKMGNDLDNPNAFPLTSWRWLWRGEVLKNAAYYLVGGTQYGLYSDFRSSMGFMTCPCELSMPIILRDGAWVLVADNNDVVAHSFSARVMGYQYVPEFTAASSDVSPEVML